MQSRDAKLLYRSGILDVAIIIPHVRGWVMKFATSNDWPPTKTFEEHNLVLQSRRANDQGVRIFKTLDAACLTANKIGFSKVTVLFEDPQKEEPQ